MSKSWQIGLPDKRYYILHFRGNDCVSILNETSNRGAQSKHSTDGPEMYFVESGEISVG